MTYINTSPSLELKKELIITLREITEGKIYLEGERARLTKMLSDILEADGDVAGAADVIQEVHVETFGSLSKMEKVEFILEQIRLVLAKKDWVRAYIVSQKVNKKALEEGKFGELKVAYYRLMIQYHSHEKDSFELAKDYFQIYKTQKLLVEGEGEGEAEAEAGGGTIATETIATPTPTPTTTTTTTTKDDYLISLKNFTLFLLLSPHSNEQNDMLHRAMVHEKESLEEIGEFLAALKTFTTSEIVPYPFFNMDKLEELECRQSGDLADHWKQLLHTRVVQHNIRVASSVYSRVSGSRLSQLLTLEPALLEREIASMVSNGDLFAKIDRPMDLICFEQGKSDEERLSEWGGDVGRLLNLVDETCHLIQKEMAR